MLWNAVVPLISRIIKHSHCCRILCFPLLQAQPGDRMPTRLSSSLPVEAPLSARRVQIDSRRIFQSAVLDIDAIFGIRRRCNFDHSPRHRLLQAEMLKATRRASGEGISCVFHYPDRKRKRYQTARTRCCLLNLGVDRQVGLLSHKHWTIRFRLHPRIFLRLPSPISTCFLECFLSSSSY